MPHLLIDKPPGMTSHDVVDRIRRITKEKRVGHAGTLDPFATGLLIIGVGRESTKTLGTFLHMDKTYEAVFYLGATSDTFDKDGAIHQHPVDHQPDHQQIKEAVISFIGTQNQRAPLYSAKKIRGQPLYRLARTGQVDESMRPVKQITIHDIRLLEYKWPLVRLVIDCSSGTYIRSLADDLGAKLQVGAYAQELRRTRIGSFSVADATPIKNLA